MHTRAFVVSLICLLLFFVVLNVLNTKANKKSTKANTSFQVQRLASQPLAHNKKPLVKKQKKDANKSLKPQLKMKFVGSGSDLGLNIAQLNAKDSSLFGNSEDAVLTEGLVDDPPTISYREPIPFPDFAKEQNLSGYVTLNILVKNDGRVEQVKVLESQPQGTFDDYALQSVKSWVFEPARLKGQKVSVWVKQKIDFQVN